MTLSLTETLFRDSIFKVSLRARSAEAIPSQEIASLRSQMTLIRTAMDYNINKLKEKGLIKRVGPDKGGHWLVVAV